MITIHDSARIDDERSLGLARYPSDLIPSKLGQSLDKFSASNLYELAKFNSEYLIYSLLFGGVDAKIGRELDASIQLILQSQVMQVYSGVGIEETLNLGNKKILVKQEKPEDLGVHEVFYWCFLCNANTLKAILLTQDLSKLIEESGWRGSFLSAHYEFLKAVLRGEAETSIEYFDSLQKKFDDLAPVDKTHLRFYISIWRAFLNGDVEEFNHECKLQLNKFRGFWGMSPDSDPNQANRMHGHFSLEISALMKLARTKGWEVNVSSEYTPEYLTNPGFRMDIDTKLDWHYSPAKKFVKGPLSAEQLKNY